MKIKFQINKTMIKMNKQRYFDVSFRYSRGSWGVLGCPGVIRPTRVHPVLGFMLSISGYLGPFGSFLTSPVKIDHY